MEEFEQEEGISLVSIIKVMFRRKLLLLCVTIGVGLVLTIAILFGYNKIKTNYSAEFTYSEPNLMEGKYVDGASFNYNSLITKANLLEIKNSNDKFKSVNVDKLLDNNAISINAKYTEAEEPKLISYTINASSKYFSSNNQAKEFVKSIVETATRINSDKILHLNFSNYFESYDAADTLDVKLNYLKKQYELINKQYLDLIELYSNYVLKSSSKSLMSYYSSFSSTFFLTDYSVDTLYSSLLNNVYVLDYDTRKDEYVDYARTYKALYETNQKKINEYKKIITDLLAVLPDAKKDSLDISMYNTELSNAVLENIDYEKMVEYYDNVLLIDPTDPNYESFNKESHDFEKKLDSSKKKLQEQTDIFEDLYIEVLNDNNNAYYLNSNVIKENGNIKTPIAIIASLALGFIIGCVVNLVLDYNKINEAPKKKEEEIKA